MSAPNTWGQVCGAPMEYIELFDNGNGYLEQKTDQDRQGYFCSWVNCSHFSDNIKIISVLFKGNIGVAHQLLEYFFFLFYPKSLNILGISSSILVVGNWKVESNKL